MYFNHSDEVWGGFPELVVLVLIDGLDRLPVFTPDDVMAGRIPSGRVVIFDDDHNCIPNATTKPRTASSAGFCRS